MWFRLNGSAGWFLISQLKYITPRPRVHHFLSQSRGNTVHQIRWGRCLWSRAEREVLDSKVLLPQEIPSLLLTSLAPPDCCDLSAFISLQTVLKVLLLIDTIKNGLIRRQSTTSLTPITIATHYHLDLLPPESNVQASALLFIVTSSCFVSLPCVAFAMLMSVLGQEDCNQLVLKKRSRLGRVAVFGTIRKTISAAFSLHHVHINIRLY